MNEPLHFGVCYVIFRQLLHKRADAQQVNSLEFGCLMPRPLPRPNAHRLMVTRRAAQMVSSCKFGCWRSQWLGQVDNLFAVLKFNVFILTQSIINAQWDASWVLMETWIRLETLEFPSGSIETLPSLPKCLIPHLRSGAGRKFWQVAPWSEDIPFLRHKGETDIQRVTIWMFCGIIEFQGFCKLRPMLTRQKSTKKWDPELG